MSLEQTLKIAAEYHRGGQFNAARSLYEEILREIPDQPVALHLLGVLAAQVGDTAAGVGWIRRAIQVWPHDVTFHINLAYILEGAGRIEEAAEAYREALELAPRDADLHFRHGNTLRLLGLMEPAGLQFEEVLRLEPGHVGALNNLGLIRAEAGRLDGALALCREAVRLAPNSAMAHSNLGHDLKLAGQIHEAVEAYRRATELEPGDAHYHSNLVYAQVFDPAASAEMIREELARWNVRHGAPLGARVGPHTNDADPERRLRIGYVSPDFCSHCQSLFTIPFLEHHDHAAFEIFCYASVERPDGHTRRIIGHADVWRDVRSLDDAALCDLIRADRIDILVDLTMHMAHGRPLVFARKPAPLQVAWLAYPGSTGLTVMDYRFTDPYLDPPNSGVDKLYAEKSLRLAATFWCYDPLDASPPVVGPPPALANGYVTFGCLNNFCKVNEGVLKLWAPVMAGMAGARLVLLADEGQHRERTLAVLEGLGVSRQRVCFESKRPRAEYLRLYQRIDIGLDTLPYNGHTTSLDSYFMGVPVVTLVGGTVVGRAGLSQLTNLGLGELIARTPEEYVRITADLARDLPRLAVLRGTLRERMRNSPLMDAPRFARDIERAYREMWRQWCAPAPVLR